METIRHQNEILDLDEAMSTCGRNLYYSHEWCTKENMVIIYDSDSVGWVRKNGLRYKTLVGVMHYSESFPAGKIKT